jgi:hypothetical protein
MESIAYVVKKPDEPFNISRLRRDRADAWRLYLQTAEEDPVLLGRQVRKACEMDGVRCCCYRLVPSGWYDDV